MALNQNFTGSITSFEGYLQAFVTSFKGFLEPFVTSFEGFCIKE